MKDDFLWLQSWYQMHCNEDWEHESRIHIGTIDNPGWSFSANLQDTELDSQKFQEVDENRSGNDWLFCFVENHKFEGRCGPSNLSEVLQVFRKWAES